MTEEQLAFEIEGMLRDAAVEAAPEWLGAPLHFSTAYDPPPELDAGVGACASGLGGHLAYRPPRSSTRTVSGSAMNASNSSTLANTGVPAN